MKTWRSKLVASGHFEKALLVRQEDALASREDFLRTKAAIPSNIDNDGASD